MIWHNAFIKRLENEKWRHISAAISQCCDVLIIQENTYLILDMFDIL